MCTLKAKKSFQKVKVSLFDSAGWCFIFSQYLRMWYQIKYLKPHKCRILCTCAHRRYTCSNTNSQELITACKQYELEPWLKFIRLVNHSQRKCVTHIWLILRLGRESSSSTILICCHFQELGALSSCQNLFSCPCRW